MSIQSTHHLLTSVISSASYPFNYKLIQIWFEIGENVQYEVTRRVIFNCNEIKYYIAIPYITSSLDFQLTHHSF